MNGQTEDAMATATAPAPEATREREQRHCPECGGTYACSSGWRPKMCPTCNGQRIVQQRARRREGAPPISSPTAHLQPSQYFRHADDSLPGTTTGHSIPYALRVDLTLPDLGEAAPVLEELNRELATMCGIATGLEGLDTDARARVMAWLVARYGEQSPWQP